MDSTIDKIILRDDELLGEGAHKKAYMHPTQKSLCVKLIKNINDTDLKRELEYRRIRDKHKQTSQLLPKYHGTINTNKGIGHVFELIYDYNGVPSQTLDNYIRSISTSPLSQAHIKDLLLSFKELWFKEKIVTSNIELVNFMVQRKSPETICIRIVDNIGSPVLIPLAYYFEYFAAKRASKYWHRFVNVLRLEFSNLIGQEIFTELDEI